MRCMSKRAAVQIRHERLSTCVSASGQGHRGETYRFQGFQDMTVLTG